MGLYAGAEKILARPHYYHVDALRGLDHLERRLGGRPVYLYVVLDDMKRPLRSLFMQLID